MKQNENTSSSSIDTEEKKYDVRLRPQSFEEYIGQKKIMENISVMVQSALMRQHAMDHVLLSGPPGLGKTSLAILIAQKLNAQLHILSGPAIEKKGDVASILTNMEAGDVLFIDEIHRMQSSVEEILYSAMEDFRLDILIGQGTAARTMRIEIAPFTLIGATTRSGMLSNPLRDRFIAHLHFDFYQTTELAQIVRNNAAKLEISISDAAIEKIATCSRGTPRIANRIIRRVRDYSLVYKKHNIGQQEVESALVLMEIDSLGLDRMDRKILQVIGEYYNGGPVGIDALAATLSEEKDTIEDVYEPYLLKEGFLLRTARGRVISQKAKEHLKLTCEQSLKFE